MTGGTPSRSKPEYFNDGYVPWLVSADVHQKEIWGCEGRITEAGLANSSAKFLPKDSVVIALNGQGKTRGTVARLRFPATCNQSVVCMEPKDRGALDDGFLFRFLDGQYAAIRNLTGEKDRRGLNMPLLRKIEIPLPPLAEQKRIVAILDEAFEGIGRAVANTQKTLAAARELFESHLNAVFSQKGEGWVEAKVSSVAQIKGGKRVPKGYKLQTEPTPHPYLTVSDFNEEGGIDESRIRYVDDEIRSKISRYIVTDSDLYVSIAGTIGRTGIVPPHLSGAQLTENACRLVFDGVVSNEFMYFFTLTDSFKEQAIRQTRIAAQPKLALSRLAEITFSHPGRKDQERLVREFRILMSNCAHLRSVSHTKLDALANLKQSILHRAFSGDLTAAPDKTLAALGA